VTINVKAVADAIIAAGIFVPTNVYQETNASVLTLLTHLQALEAKVAYQEQYIQHQNALIAQHETSIRHIEAYLSQSKSI
jgi:hypothetical protein